MFTRIALVLTLVFGSALVSGCASTSIAVKEAFGYPKRDQLVARVTDVRDAQGEAKKQFESALAEFLSVTGVKTGEIEAKYGSLKKEYDRSESKAQAVRDRIKSVEAVSDALFAEWRKELAE